MQKYIWRYGGLGALLLAVLFTLTYGLGRGHIPYRFAELAGYVIIFLAMSFVYFGIRRYRDEEMNGAISFGRALSVGSLIVLVPSVAMGLFTIVFFYIRAEEWLAYALGNMPSEQEAQFQANEALFTHPFFQGGVMFITALLIGMVVAAVSGALLKRSAG